MSTLDEAEKKRAPVTHLLIIGQTKSGKSDYVAQAAMDGFTVIYLDRDNGLGTLLEAIGDKPEVKKRIHYFAPDNMIEFLDYLFTSSVLRYNDTKGKMLNPLSIDPEDKIVEIIPSLIPRNSILTIDSWSAVASNAVEMKAESAGFDLMEAEKYTREIYGGTGFALTRLARGIQTAPFHVIVQAHPGVYERKERPPGRVEGITEKDMIVKETIQVPISTSMPHGYTLGKFFNQIGWLQINRMNKHELDFTIRHDRIGGGTPNKAGDPRGEMRFSKLFGNGRTEAPLDPAQPWIQTLTGAEYKERQANKHANAPKLIGGKLTS